MLTLMRPLATWLASLSRRGRPSLCAHQPPPMALLIDGENIGAEWAAAIVAKASLFGVVTIRRIYGDWASAQMASWRTIAECYGFQQVQVPRAVPGKNAVDLALAVDAMDLFFGGLRCFCLASSDSDYAPLVRRLRAAGCFVLGIGRPPISQMLQAACQVFLTTDQLHPLLLQREAPATGLIHPAGAKEVKECPAPVKEALAPPMVSQSMTTGSAQPKQGTIPAGLLCLAYQEASKVSKRQDGWVSESQLGQHLHKLDTLFKVKTYGFRRLRELLERARAEGLLEIQHSDGKQWYVRLLAAASSQTLASASSPSELEEPALES
uniref:HTH OST-type domain-containing protein n=1 Tax=Thermogemmatispora argillosa TaxID=2045280 RepID=A0A455SY50_9CHLR|nr:hypothetical protein KTA_02380 [Thermogemmatispora argillosa]